ncbi:MAG: Urease accessory protein UreD [Chthoniobacteraceae bacterium]|nr:Urease accessory protein UreD [Chthoniobacteraceae bacterium]
MNRGLHGHLELICALDSGGRSYLRHQSFQAPMHLSKPHLDEGVLVVNMVNPTAGLLAGDRIRLKADVESGARLLLTTPSAARAHRMLADYAEVTQEFSVAAGGWLENLPELFIPQAGSRYRQRTVIRVEKGGDLLFFETLAPGRVASGESFQYDWLDWETDLFHGDQLIARECYKLSPGNESLVPMRALFPNAYYASCFFVTEQLGADHPCWASIHALHTQEVWVGCGALKSGGWTIKIVAAGSILLRRTLALVRKLLYTALGRALPSLRRAIE